LSGGHLRYQLVWARALGATVPTWAARVLVAVIVGEAHRSDLHYRDVP
jgi:hypothetical protein